MKKLKVLSLILASIMLIALLGSCGEKKNDETKSPETNVPAVTDSPETDSQKPETEPVETEPVETEPDIGGLAGGWTINGDAKSAYLPEAINNAYNISMDGLEGAEYTPIAYIGSRILTFEAEHYAVLCLSKAVVPDPKPELKIVVVNDKEEGDPEILRINDFSLSDYAGQGENIASGEFDETPGQWSFYAGEVKADLGEKVQAACDATLKGVMGRQYTPVVCLGTQVVAGTNYAVLCIVRTEANDQPIDQRILTIYEDLDGNCSVIGEKSLDLAAIAGEQ